MVNRGKGLGDADKVVIELPEAFERLPQRRWPDKNAVVTIYDLSDVVVFTIHFRERLGPPFVAAEIASAARPLDHAVTIRQEVAGEFG